MNILKKFILPGKGLVVLGCPDFYPEIGPARIGGRKVFICGVEHSGKWEPGRMVGVILANTIAFDSIIEGQLLYQDYSHYYYFGKMYIC